MNYKESDTRIMFELLISGRIYDAARLCDKVKTEMMKLETGYKLTDTLA